MEDKEHQAYGKAYSTMGIWFPEAAWKCWGKLSETHLIRLVAKEPKTSNGLEAVQENRVSWFEGA